MSKQANIRTYAPKQRRLVPAHAPPGIQDFPAVAAARKALAPVAGSSGSLPVASSTAGPAWLALLPTSALHDSWLECLGLPSGYPARETGRREAPEKNEEGARETEEEKFRCYFTV